MILFNESARSSRQVRTIEGLSMPFDFVFLGTERATVQMSQHMNFMHGIYLSNLISILNKKKEFPCTSQMNVSF